MEIKLKPCPFCGGKANINMLDQVRNRDWYAGCKACGAWIESFPTAEKAAAAWNRRTR